MKTIYVAGPYTVGDVAANVRAAVDAGSIIISHGDLPIIPHLFHFVHMIHPRPYHVWTKLDNELILKCSALLRIPGPSRGAEDEIDFALQHKIPVYYSLEQLYGPKYSLQGYRHPREPAAEGVRSEGDRGTPLVDPQTHRPAPTDSAPR